jgi:nitrilase
MRIAAAQARPAWLDPDATTRVVVDHLQRAAADGVDLLAFPEAFLSG